MNTVQAVNFDISSSLPKIGGTINCLGRAINTNSGSLSGVMKLLWDQAKACITASFAFLVANPHIGIPVAIGVGLLVIGAAIGIIFYIRSKNEDNIFKKTSSSKSSSESSESSSESSESSSETKQSDNTKAKERIDTKENSEKSNTTEVKGQSDNTKAKEKSDTKENSEQIDNTQDKEKSDTKEEEKVA